MLLEVGRIVKPHGVRGEVIVDLLTDRTERLAPGMVLDSDRGALTVVRSSAHHHRWIVVFDGVGSREAADELRNVVLRAESVDDDDAEALWVHELIGSTVVAADGRELGPCVAVVANPASDLLELESGALIPATFIVDTAPGRVTVDLPEGLLEL